MLDSFHNREDITWRAATSVGSVNRPPSIIGRLNRGDSTTPDGWENPQFFAADKLLIQIGGPVVDEDDPCLVQGDRQFLQDPGNGFTGLDVDADRRGALHMGTQTGV